MIISSMFYLFIGEDRTKLTECHIVCCTTMYWEGHSNLRLKNFDRKESVMRRLLVVLCVGQVIPLSVLKNYVILTNYLRTAWNDGLHCYSYLIFEYFVDKVLLLTDYL